MILSATIIQTCILISSSLERSIFVALWKVNPSETENFIIRVVVIRKGSKPVAVGREVPY
jgi:hypothetical protein